MLTNKYFVEEIHNEENEKKTQEQGEREGEKRIHLNTFTSLKTKLHDQNEFTD